MTNKQATALGFIMLFQGMIMEAHDINIFVVITAFVLAFALILTGNLGTHNKDK